MKKTFVLFVFLQTLGCFVLANTSDTGNALSTNSGAVVRPPSTDVLGQVINPTTGEVRGEAVLSQERQLNAMGDPIITNPKYGPDARSIRWISSEEQAGKKHPDDVIYVHESDGTFYNAMGMAIQVRLDKDGHHIGATSIPTSGKHDGMMDFEYNGGSREWITARADRLHAYNITKESRLNEGIIGPRKSEGNLRTVGNDVINSRGYVVGYVKPISDPEMIALNATKTNYDSSGSFYRDQNQNLNPLNQAIAKLTELYHAELSRLKQIYSTPGQNRRPAQISIQ